MKNANVIKRRVRISFERPNVCELVKCWFQNEKFDAVEDISEPIDSIRCVYGIHCFYSFFQSDNSIWNQKAGKDNNGSEKSGVF